MTEFIGVDVATGRVFQHTETTGGLPEDRPGVRYFEINGAALGILSAGEGTFDIETRTYTPDAKPDYGETVGPRAFLLLFTPAQRKAIMRTSKTDEDLADFMAVVQVPEPIRLKHPLTQSGLAMLVAKGLLTQAEATRIGENRPPSL
jgi:hypothetical protein